MLQCLEPTFGSLMTLPERGPKYIGSKSQIRIARDYRSGIGPRRSFRNYAGSLGIKPNIAHRIGKNIMRTLVFPQNMVVRLPLQAEWSELCIELLTQKFRSQKLVA